ncbi:hypothetical protein VULLAG_LOCUS1849 [Vulpes lagopus]
MGAAGPTSWSCGEEASVRCQAGCARGTAVALTAGLARGRGGPEGICLGRRRLQSQGLSVLQRRGKERGISLLGEVWGATLALAASQCPGLGASAGLGRPTCRGLMRPGSGHPFGVLGQKWPHRVETKRQWGGPHPSASLSTVASSPT